MPQRTRLKGAAQAAGALLMASELAAWTQRKRWPRASEALDVQVGEGEEVWEEGGGAVPEEAGSAHAGVESQVADGGAALAHGFGGDVAGGLEGDEWKGDAGLNHGADFIGEDTAEDLDGHAKVGQGERLEGFGDGDARGARGDEGLGDGADTQSIGIGLEHGHDGAGRGHAAYGAIVLGECAEIDGQNNAMLHGGGEERKTENGERKRPYGRRARVGQRDFTVWTWNNPSRGVPRVCSLFSVLCSLYYAPTRGTAAMRRLV